LGGGEVGGGEYARAHATMSARRGGSDMKRLLEAIGPIYLYIYSNISCI